MNLNLKSHIYTMPEDNPETTLQRNTRKCRFIWLGIVGAIIALIILTSVLATSFKYVEYDEYAFRQYTYGKVDLDRVYTQGRYQMAPLYKMVKLPSTYQKIDIESPVFLNNGMEIIIKVIVYYHLVADNLGNIYHQFSMSYDDRIENIAKTTIKDSATSHDFSIDNYVVDRELIQEVFTEEVLNELMNSIGVVIPGSIRLLDITFPDSVINSSLISAIEKQNNEVQHLRQTVAVIEADTQQQIANITLEAALLTASANIEAGLITSNSQSEANGIVTSARGEGIESVLTTLNITTPALRDEFIRLVAILDSTTPKILSGAFTPLITV